VPTYLCYPPPGYVFNGRLRLPTRLVFTRVPFARAQLAELKRLSRKGPFYRFAVYLLARFWSAVRALLRTVRGEAMDTPPGKAQTPILTISETTVDAITVKWAACPSSFWSEDSYELQAREVPGAAGAGAAGAGAGPGAGAIDGEWRDVPVPLGALEATLSGLRPGQGFELRCRARNSKGVGPWSLGATLAFARQPPRLKGGGGGGPGYEWRQSNKVVQAAVPLPGPAAGCRAKQVRVACAKGRALTVAVAPAPAAPEVELLSGELSAKVDSSSLEWDIQVSFAPSSFRSDSSPDPRHQATAKFLHCSEIMLKLKQPFSAFPTSPQPKIPPRR
jgi:hypothetical protein